MGEDVGAELRSHGWAGFGSRWLGSVALRGAAFEAVAGDPRALGQAAAVVVAGGIGRGIGAFAQEGWLGLAGGTALALVMWIVASALVWGIAIHRPGPDSGFPELLRSLGFAAAPLVGLAPCALLPSTVGGVVAGLLHAWATLAFAVATRAALGVPMVRALWICAAALAGALALLLAAGFFLFDALLVD